MSGNVLPLTVLPSVRGNQNKLVILANATKPGITVILEVVWGTRGPSAKHRGVTDTNGLVGFELNLLPFNSVNVTATAKVLNLQTTCTYEVSVAVKKKEQK